jgi:predicted HNH restriction endonuclease
MDEDIARIISRLPDLERVQNYETNATTQGRLDEEMRAALRERRIELGRAFVAERTGLDLTRLTPAEEGVVRAVSEYASIKKRAGTNAERTLRQVRERGLLGAAEASVMKSKPTQGFDELADNGLSELSYEQIIVDHAEEFSDRAQWFARRTLKLPNDSPQAPARLSSPTQRRTESLLGWLSDRAREMDGGLGLYTNADAAAAIGMPDLSVHGRVFGNIQSRIDFACYLAGLPPLGLAAAAPFTEAWQPEDRSWSFPVTAMQAASKSFSWQERDFERVLDESEGLPGQASISWHEELGARQDAVRDWAFGLRPGGSSPTGEDIVARSNQRNPDWTRDELILALEAYMRYRVKSFSKTSPEIRELSERLLALANIRGIGGGATFRNINGAYMKLSNFRASDPEYTSQGKKGLASANSLEDEIWDAYAQDPIALDTEFQRILAEIAGGGTASLADVSVLESPRLSGEDLGAIATLLGANVDGESDRAILAKLEGLYRDASPAKKSRVSTFIERGPIGAAVKKANGYRCQLCAALGRDPIGFKKRSGIPYVEAHHVTLVSTGAVGSLSATNIITLCANHHREVHYGDVTLVADEQAFTLRVAGETVVIERFDPSLLTDAT